MSANIAWFSSLLILAHLLPKNVYKIYFLTNLFGIRCILCLSSHSLVHTLSKTCHWDVTHWSRSDGETSDLASQTLSHETASQSYRLDPPCLHFLSLWSNQIQKHCLNTFPDKCITSISNVSQNSEEGLERKQGKRHLRKSSGKIRTPKEHSPKRSESRMWKFWKLRAPNCNFHEGKRKPGIMSLGVYDGVIMM